MGTGPGNDRRAVTRGRALGSGSAPAGRFGPSTQRQPRGAPPGRRGRPCSRRARSRGAGVSPRRPAAPCGFGPQAAPAVTERPPLSASAEPLRNGSGAEAAPLRAPAPAPLGVPVPSAPQPGSPPTSSTSQTNSYCEREARFRKSVPEFRKCRDRRTGNDVRAETARWLPWQQESLERPWLRAAGRRC